MSQRAENNPTTGGDSGAAKLLSQPVAVVNVGLEGFVDELRSNGVPVVQIAWIPPAGGDPKMAALLAKLGV